MKPLIALVLAAACATRPAPPALAARVEVTNWPEREPPDCSIPELGPAPEEPAWPSAAEDYYRRQYVHRRDYALAIQYARDLGAAVAAMRECLEALVEVEER
jgi:hypothetical protein